MNSAALILVLALLAPDAFSRGSRRPEAPATAPAQPGAEMTAAEVATRVQAYLSSIDRRVSIADWRALGPKAVAPLQSVLQDPQALPSRRSRAVGALAVIGGPQASRLVLDTAHSGNQPFAVRAAAVEGAGHLLKGKALSDALRPVLEQAREAPLRATAAEVLAGHAGASGCAAVRAQVAREPRESRGHFARALQRCGAASP